jgi:tetratricopeptide (TPR) repeat protein
VRMSLIEKALIKSKSQPPSSEGPSGPLSGPRMEHILGGQRPRRPRTTLMAALCVVSLVLMGAGWFLVSYAPEVARGLRGAARLSPREEARPQRPPSMTTEQAPPEVAQEAPSPAPVAAGGEKERGPVPSPVAEDSAQGPLAQVSVQPEAPDRASPLPEARRAPTPRAGQPVPRGKAKGESDGPAPLQASVKPATAAEERRQVLLEKAFLAGQAGDTRAAMDIYTELLREEPGLFEALLNRGILRQRSGDHAGAKADLLRAKELRPQDPVLLNALGVLYLGLDEPEQAAIYLKMAGEPFSMINLALLYWRRGERDRAMASLEEARMRDPHDPRVPYYKAVLLLQQGDTRQAQQEMERAAILARKRGDMELLRRLEAPSIGP